MSIILSLTRSTGHAIWDPTRYYNIYTCNIASPGVLGLAQLPGTLNSVNSSDGCLLDSAEVGSITFQGSTISHETAHYLGLRHTFDTGKCSDEDMLDVHDTPQTALDALQYVPQKNDLTPCANTFQRCGGITMVRNVMDYNYEQCLAYFTKGQAMVMRRYLTAAGFTRRTLTSSPALPGPCPAYSCLNKTCGDDGCGGVCGLCPTTQTCSASNMCFASPKNFECAAALSIVPARGAGLRVIGDLKGTQRVTDCCKFC